jgi:DNA-binding transcriptional MerR regulator
MQIKELAQRTGLQDKTIRYYEEIGVLLPPKRLPNGYRDYKETDVERVKFVMGMRRLDFSLDDITEILAMRDRREAPCRTVLDLIQRNSDVIAQRIVELQHLESELRELYTLGLTFPTDDIDGKNCVCHLIQEHGGE